MSKRRDKNILTFLILATIFLMFLSNSFELKAKTATVNPILRISSYPVSSGIKFTLDGVEHMTPWSGETIVGNHILNLSITQNIDGTDYVFILWSSTILIDSTSSNIPLYMDITGDTSISIMLKEKKPNKPRKFGYVIEGIEIAHFYSGDIQSFLSDVETCGFQVIMYADDKVNILKTQSISYLKQIATYCDSNGLELLISLANNLTVDETSILNSVLDLIGYHISITHYLIWSEWSTWNEDYEANRQAYLNLKVVVDAHKIPNFGHWLYQRAEKYGRTYNEGLVWLNSVNSNFLFHHNFIGIEETKFDREYWVIDWVDNSNHVEKTFGISIGIWIPEYFITPTEIIRVIETCQTTKNVEIIFFTGNGNNHQPSLPEENIATYASIYDRYPNVFIKEQPYTTIYPTVITTTYTIVITKKDTTIITTTTTDSTVITTTYTTPIPTTYTTLIPTTYTTFITPTSSIITHDYFIEINDIGTFLILTADVVIPILLYILFIHRKKNE